MKRIVIALTGVALAGFATAGVVRATGGSEASHSPGSSQDRGGDTSQDSSTQQLKEQREEQAKQMLIAQAQLAKAVNKGEAKGGDRSAVYKEAAAYLQSFLASWEKDGLYAAGQMYLDPSMGVKSDAGEPVLVAGTVTHTKPGQWVSADHFTMIADLDLRFSGEAGAWGNGLNARFVTFVRTSASAPFQIVFATGP